MGAPTDLPDRFADIVEDFAAVSAPDRLQLLIELGQQLPDLPERFRQQPELLETVLECQAPVYVLAELVGSGEQAVVRLYLSAPPQAPITRGFAGILHAALDGLPVREVLALPSDVSARLGLDEAVSPLRLRGMAGMLARIKRQVTDKAR